MAQRIRAHVCTFAVRREVKEAHLNHAELKLLNADAAVPIEIELSAGGEPSGHGRWRHMVMQSGLLEKLIQLCLRHVLAHANEDFAQLDDIQHPRVVGIEFLVVEPDKMR